MSILKKLCLVAGLGVLPSLGCDGIVDCHDCCDDCPPPTPPPAQRFENLSERWHVLNNVELAYNKRRIDKYDEVLDANYTFFLSTLDASNGLPTQWDRAVDLSANANLFNSDPPDPLPRCRDIDILVQWHDEGGAPSMAWVEVTRPGDEKWYTTTVFYDFQFDVEPDMTYINNPGAKVQFTVRNAGMEQAPQWRLVEMRDLGDPELIVRATSGTEQSTWGQVKALYRN